MVCDYMVRTGLTGADSIESVARNLSLSSYYKRANRAQLSRRRLTKCTAGTERRRRHSENECRIAFGNRVSECESVSWRESYAISESLSPRRPPHSVCLLLFRLFITIGVIIIALIVVFSFCCCCCCISFYLDFQFAAIDAEKGIWRVIK